MASSAFFHKPELALRRAIELEGIHQEEAALTLLHDILSSRRHRTWSPAYEQIMIAYLDLCLKLFKSREAKDGLHQYRNLSQSQAPGSLEKVIRYLMDKAEATCTAAKAFVDAETLASTSEDDDGEGFSASPQAILLSTMSTDPAKSQRDSALLLPALKFLWETYRAVLDILRSNSKLEHVYHAAAQGALRFCRVYKRRMEFRHLCDMLRMHLGNLRQYGAVGETGDDVKTNNKVRGWEGWTTESIELHLQTRFAQLETASVLHRYTEGFRTVEDIYNILQISQLRRKNNPDIPPPKAKLMATYYEKLTTLFWVSENYLFHAFAWYKYYSLCKEFNRGMSDEMKKMQASAVLLAALCIPQLPNQGGSEEKGHVIGTTIQDDIVKQKTGRMATLLGFHTRNPTREALLTEIKSKNILDQVPEYLRELYLLLESDADPLVMVSKASPLLEELKAQTGASTTTDWEKNNEDVEDSTLGRYVKPLTKVLLLKLIVNLSTAYHTVSMDHLKKLTGGLDMTFEQVEKAIVLFTQQIKTPAVRIDHRAGCLRFGDAQLESNNMRLQLTVLSKQLEAVNRVLIAPTADLSGKVQRRTKIYSNIREKLSAEHDAILERKNLIEKRKEEAERLAQEKIKEEARIKAEEDAARKLEEEKRIVREQKLREQEKQRKIQVELENQEKKRVLAAMGKKTDEISEQEMANIDTEALQKEHQDNLNKMREDAERKTKEIAKRLDYLVRAIRIEELPLIKERYEEKTKKDKERYEQETEEKIKKAKAQWEADVKDKLVFQEHGVFQYFAEFEEKVIAGRKIKHGASCREAEAQAEIDAEKGKIARARKRRDDEIKRKVDEENRRKKEEEDRKADEERRKKDEARREREAKEDERRQAELKRMDEERRKRESEQTKSAPPSAGGAGGPSKYVPPSLRSKMGSGSAAPERSNRFGGDAGGYPGGGRYEGRRADDRGPGDGGGGGAWRGGGGGRDDRGGGGRDDRGGGGRDDRGGGGRDDRRGGFDDRRGGGGGPGGDRRGGFDDRAGGGGGGGLRDRDGGRGGGGPAAGNTRWRN